MSLLHKHSKSRTAQGETNKQTKTKSTSVSELPEDPGKHFVPKIACMQRWVSRSYDMTFFFFCFVFHLTEPETLLPAISISSSTETALWSLDFSHSQDASCTADSSISTLQEASLCASSSLLRYLISVCS